MTSTTALRIATAVALAVVFADAGADERRAGARHGHGSHEHVVTPAAYATRHAPPSLWTDGTALQRGARIYRERCAICHGEHGDGKGPGATGLTLEPADMTDARSVAEMTDTYWFWRVSEGGQVEPFRSRGSAMPAWKDVLSVEDRWAVIAHQHTLSGHRGPHVGGEHPELARHEGGQASPAATGSSR